MAGTVFELANVLAGARHYQLRMVSEAGGPVTCSAGVTVHTEGRLSRA